MKKRMKYIFFTIILTLMLTTIPSIYAYEGVDFGSNNGYVVHNGSKLDYISVNGSPYVTTYKTLVPSGHTEPGTFIAFCIDHIFDTPTENWRYNWWNYGKREVTYCLKNGYPYVHFTGDNNKDYYITNIALQILLQDDRGYSNGGKPVETNLLSKEIENGNCTDPQGLRPYIMKLVEDSRTKSVEIYVIPGKITQLNPDGNSYVTNKISVSATVPMDRYEILLNDSGCSVVSQDSDGFVLRIPDSVIKGNVNEAIGKIQVKGYFTGGISAVFGGVYEQQRVVTLQDFEDLKNITIDIGNLTIEKKDEHNQFREGAKFKVEGPSGTFYPITGTDGKAYVNNIVAGIYTITEIEAPEGTVLNPEIKTVEVTITPGQTVTFTCTNPYPRGSATLSKYDKDNPGNTKGDATLAGAIYNLYAAETIKEGEETIYTANQIVKENIVTDEYGNTEVITNLPVGNYYYKEIKPSEGFNINPDRVDFTIKYIDQNTPVIPTVENVAPESPIYGNIRIVKKLEATDYDPQKLLKDVQFKATYVDESGTKHEDQVYYSNVSGEDGICEINHIPYGTYEIEEIKYPKEARKVENFTVEVREHNKTIEIEKEDPIVDMRIEVYKEVVVEEGEATDAKAEGAYFTVYRDQGCAEDSKVCVIGPTDENGYAISGTMVMGTYYLKETEFPEGIDENAIIPGENVTYKDKVYTVTYEDTSEGTEPAKIGIKIINVPIRNSIEMIKTVGETTSSKKSPLKGAEFTATLISSKGTENEFSRKCTAPTDENGYCIIEDLPYGEYIIEETTVPDITLKCSDFKLFVEKTEEDLGRKYQMTDVEFVDPKNTLDDVVKDWLDQNGYLEDEPKTMKIKIKKVDANREETDEPDMTQGDATLEGAIYQLYKYNEEKGDYSTHVYDITVDHKDEDGYWCAETGDLLVGKYMIKEKIKYTEIKDGVTYNYSYAEGYLADPKEYYFEQVPGEQEVKRTYHEDISREEVIRGRVEVIKQNNIPGQTEEVASAGAILRLTLISNPDVYYEATIDENGYAEFVEEESMEYYPYTLPYGKYELTEIAESNPEEHTHWFIQSEDVTIEKQTQKEYRIESDEPVEMYPLVMKLDEEDRTTVCLKGTEFKIWDIKNKEWVVMYDTANDEYIDTYKTNDEGNFMTPQKLVAGEYVVYETKAPYGYVLNEEWKIPEKEEDLGNPQKGGKYVKIDKIALGIANDEEYPGLDEGDLVYRTELEDKRVKGKIVVYKTGEVLTDVNIISGEYGVEKTPVYANRGLEGVTYDIYAAEDIVSPDGRTTYKEAGDYIETIKTDESGYAESSELDLGKYYVKEVSTSDDRVIVNDEPIDVELEYEGQEVPVVTENLELENKNKNAKLSFDKIFEESEYDIEEEKYAVFGVYAGHDIINYQGKTVIYTGDLIQTIRVDKQGTVEETLNLPAGEYYYQEIEASSFYTKDENKYQFLIDYSQDVPLVEIEGEDITNPPETADLMLLKLSTSAAIKDETGLYGEEYVSQLDLDSVSQKILEKINNMSKEEIIEYFKNNDNEYIENLNYLLKGAEYSVYLDEECTKPLKYKDGTEVKIITEEYGVAELKDLPLDEYYLKETKAPVTAELSSDVVRVDLTIGDAEDKDIGVVCRVLYDKPLGFTFEKTDIFTGDKVEDCEFIITDEDGNQIVEMTTDKEGKAEIPIDMLEQGKTYYYQEIEAPDIYKEDGKLYKLNTEPHKFVLDYTIDYEKEEIVWNEDDKEEVENYRPVIKELIVKKTDEETGEPLQGCKFSIVLLDENGEPYVNEAGETVYLVKDAVTDENGEYRVEKPVYGTYKFIEVEAPEGYDLAEQEMEGYEFTINDETPDTLIFEVTNTGDIAVVAIAVVAVVCIAGIVFVIIRHKRQK